MEIKSNLKYLESHEWAQIDGGNVKIGITDYAQNELGDIVFAELPSVGDSVVAGEEFANVESVKAVSPVISPVTGIVTAVNDALDASPELINEAAYDAWFIEVKAESLSDNLLSSDEYAALLK